MRTAIVAALGLAAFGSIAALAQTQSGPTGPRTAVVRNAAVDASGSIHVAGELQNNLRVSYELVGR